MEKSRDGGGGPLGGTVRGGAGEPRYLLAALTALSADLDPVLALAAELEAARAELATVTESRDHWQRQASIGTAAFDARVDGIIQGLSGRGIPRNNGGGWCSWRTRTGTRTARRHKRRPAGYWRTGHERPLLAQWQRLVFPPAPIPVRAGEQLKKGNRYPDALTTPTGQRTKRGSGPTRSIQPTPARTV